MRKMFLCFKNNAVANDDKLWGDMMFSISDLFISYRKAKADIYYSTCKNLTKIAEYEDNISENLKNLLSKINSDVDGWVSDSAFIGDYTLVAKSVSSADMPERKEDSLIFSSASDQWEHGIQMCGGKKQPKAEFRIMANCSLDFHVLSTLWIMKVGHLFDAKLNECAYGNRLRRTQDGKINELSLGSFQPYLKPFREWRDKGISAIRTALGGNNSSYGNRIVALTADVSSFYHELNPCFMLDPEYISKVLDLKLSEEQSKLNSLFIKALQAWATATPLKKGLPVGLPASAVVANVALIELDRFMEQEVNPIYYGRYVDDILLVMKDGMGFSSVKQLWDWLLPCSDEKLGWSEDNNSISFHPSYHKKNSQIHFGNGKNKVFILTGETGKSLIDAISHEIHERASEWRAMPRLPLSADHIGTDLFVATQGDGDAADSLRKTDALTVRKASFAIKLRDFEAYERDLLPEAWVKHRRAFFKAFVRHVIVLPIFFDLSVYLPRVIRLATACEDFAELGYIIKAVENIVKQIQEQCEITIKACPEGSDNHNNPSREKIIDIWKDQLFYSIRESITAAFPPKLSSKGDEAWRKHGKSLVSKIFKSDLPILPLLCVPSSSQFGEKELQTQQARLFSLDLAHMPFRFIGLPKEMVTQRGIPDRETVTFCTEILDSLKEMVTQRGIPDREEVMRCAGSLDSLQDKVIAGNQKLASWIGFEKLPRGLLFATRPFNLPELFILNECAFDSAKRGEMESVVLSTRGFRLGDKAPYFDDKETLQISDSVSHKTYTIGVSSWQTKMDSWIASVARMEDPDTNRYVRLCRLLDTVISEPHSCRYLVFPELALPANWFIRVARKLYGRGISLISGIEYLHCGDARVHNQVWVSLCYDGLGFPSLMIYRQDKQHPALHEEEELHRVSGLKLEPLKSWKTPPVIQHGNFRFSVLICSELTNINYRSSLRGNVDALFVPEWNQDTETFNSLVESAALDMHAYIIQCNDRQYGDSRIRAPFKDSWKRDVLRVKGGITDYCVIGEINVEALRQFQSSHRSPKKLFKPVPDGFEINPVRKRLPWGADE